MSLNPTLLASGDSDKEGVINSNMQLLDGGLTGRFTQAMADANQTLSAADSLGNLVFRTTGALTAGRNLVLGSTEEKLYILQNDCTGFAVTMKTSAGTGIAVPVGEKRWLYCDGTNVVDVLTAYVASTRSIISGAGLTGGGDLSADRTLAVGAGTGITVNADDVAVNQGFSPSWTGAHSFTGGTITVPNPAAAAQALRADLGAPVILSWAASALTVSVGTTYYLFPWATFSTAGTTARPIIVPRAGIIRNLRVISRLANSGGSVTYTVQKRSAGGGTGAFADLSPSLTCTVAVSATAGSDLSNAPAVSAGDELILKLVENASYSGSTTDIIACIEYTMY